MGMLTAEDSQLQRSGYYKSTAWRFARHGSSQSHGWCPAVDAEKVKAAMRDRIRDVRAVFMTFVMTIKYINQKVFFYKQVYNRGGNVLP